MEDFKIKFVKLRIWIDVIWLQIFRENVYFDDSGKKLHPQEIFQM